MAEASRSSGQPGARPGVVRGLRRASWPRSEPACFHHRPDGNASAQPPVPAQAVMAVEVSRHVETPRKAGRQAAMHLRAVSTGSLLACSLAADGSEVGATESASGLSEAAPPPPGSYSRQSILVSRHSAKKKCHTKPHTTCTHMHAMHMTCTCACTCHVEMYVLQRWLTAKRLGVRAGLPTRVTKMGGPLLLLSLSLSEREPCGSRGAAVLSTQSSGRSLSLLITPVPAASSRVQKKAPPGYNDTHTPAGRRT